MYRLLFAAIFCIIFTSSLSASVTVDGTKEQRQQIADWLTSSLETEVSVDPASGEMSIAAGGNASAARLRKMLEDGAVAVTLKIVVDDDRVHYGGFQESGGMKTKSNGVQLIDVGDIGRIGNTDAKNGITADTVLIHEITECYVSVKDGLDFEAAHKEGIQAEAELIGEHGSSFVGARTDDQGYTKIKRKDGTYVVFKRNKDGSIQWYKEQQPCISILGRTAVGDPDPQVWIYDHTYGSRHKLIGKVDTEKSAPRGVAYDREGNLYVSEDLGRIGEIRIFDREGGRIGTIRHKLMRGLRGITVDRVSGDIFVAAQDRVLRFDAERRYQGSYMIKGTFRPEDIAVFRRLPRSEIQVSPKTYDILVTDSAGSLVYRFSVAGDMNRGTSRQAFGHKFLKGPTGISIDGWYSVWVVSPGNHRIYRFTPDGRLEPYGERPYFVEDRKRKFADVEMIDFYGVYVVDATPEKGALILYDYDGNLIHVDDDDGMQCPTSIDHIILVDESNLIPFNPEEESTVPDKIYRKR